jgi:hypothetical protein
MHWIPATWLIKTYNTPLSSTQQQKDKEQKPIKNTAAVIVETRPSIWLLLVMRNVQDKLGEQCNLYLVAPESVHNFIQHMEPDLQYAAIHLDGAPSKITVDQYSSLLLREEFWTMFTNEEYVFIYQTDCIVVRPLPNWAYHYDFIGPVCGSLSENSFIINGGLSLRNKNAMIQACRALTEEERALPEDVAFCTCLRRLQKQTQGSPITLPTMKECSEFGIESVGNVQTCVGLHGTDKYYTTDTVLTQLLVE